MRRFSELSSPYQMINILTGLLVIFILAYSAVYSATGSGYPAECTHVRYLGEECPACGLSQSFSEMIRGRFSSAAGYNRNGPLIFAFFASQLILRAFAGFLVYRIEGRNGARGIPVPAASGGGEPEKAALKIRRVAATDAVVSILLFIICFRHLLVFW